MLPEGAADATGGPGGRGGDDDVHAASAAMPAIASHFAPWLMPLAAGVLVLQLVIVEQWLASAP
jgi:hypothetical protein